MADGRSCGSNFGQPPAIGHGTSNESDDALLIAKGQPPDRLVVIANLCSECANGVARRPVSV